MGFPGRDRRRLRPTCSDARHIQVDSPPPGIQLRVIVTLFAILVGSSSTAAAACINTVIQMILIFNRANDLEYLVN